MTFGFGLCNEFIKKNYKKTVFLSKPSFFCKILINKCLRYCVGASKGNSFFASGKRAAYSLSMIEKLRTKHLKKPRLF